ncbi:TnpV protein, partial [Anaerostipes hadrus]|nr:TnpV protein [Anaerostipes hadrus]
MGKIVFMFPGQGAQYVGMGKDFYDSFACSKEIFDKANEVLDIDVKKLCFEENEDINITEYTQAAMRKQFLKEHRSARYQYLVLTGKLTEHLNQVDKEA